METLVSILTSFLASSSAIVALTAFLRIRRKKREKEKLWKRFKSWMSPHLQESTILAEAYVKAVEAKAEKEISEARKIMAEAAEIAARRELEIQKEGENFLAIVDDIFVNDELTEATKALKLAKLIEKNPEIAAQLVKVKEIIEKLALKDGLNFELLDESQKSPPEKEKETEP